MVGRSATTDERLDACRRGQSMSGGHDEQLYPASPFVSRQGGRLRSDWVAAFDRNRWPPSAGIGGHFASDSADATGPVAVDEMGRSAQTFHNIAGRMIVGPVPFANLRAMMARAETALESFSPDEVNGWAGKELDLQIGPRRLAFTSETFILSFALPNFHFHAVTAYDILRSPGVPLGKRDYEGQLRTRPA
jgi:hypothetical protein